MIMRNIYRSIELIFVSHPQNVCMTYLEHLQFSCSLAYTLSIGAVKALIHAFFPNMYITSTTDLANDLQKKIELAGCK